MIRFIAIPLLVLTAGAPGRGGGAALDLLTAGRRWAGRVSGKCAVTHESSKRGLTVTMELDGDAEDFPYVWLSWGRPQDWRGYQRLRARFRLLAQTPHVPHKIVRFVVYDANTRWLNRKGQPAKQQLITLMPETDRWHVVDLSLLGIRRGAVTALSLYCYELPPGHAHSLWWEIERLELVGPGSGQCVFDGGIWPAEAMRLDRVATAFTRDGPDGLRLGLSTDGRIADLWAGTHVVTGGRATGLLVRDASGNSVPRPFGGHCEIEQGGVRHRATAQELGLSLDAHYCDRGDYVEVAPHGTVMVSID